MFFLLGEIATTLTILGVIVAMFAYLDGKQRIAFKFIVFAAFSLIASMCFFYQDNKSKWANGSAMAPSAFAQMVSPREQLEVIKGMAQQIIACASSLP